MNNTNEIELLSPAGSFDALKQAVHNGADAVYLGGTHFGARAYANNFDNDQLIEAINYAHLYGVKIYVTVNTLIFESEIPEFKKYIDFLASVGADALILQDIGMADWIINSFSIPVHSSTQMHNYSLSNIEYLKDAGFDRAVAARETDINTVRKMSDVMETEIFVHGALCISYSGQCLFSAFEHDRSGNRGKCAQACRMKYSLYQNDDLLIEDKYLLSPKDLALLDDTSEIIKANAASLKLEGRMKPPEYVGFITGAYRKIIDEFYAGRQSKISSEQQNTFLRLFNRGFTKGYVFGLDNESLMSMDRPNHAGVYIGAVVDVNKSFISIKLNDTLRQGDGVKFDKADKGFVCNKIYHMGKLVSAGEAEQTIQLENKINLQANDRLMLTKDINLANSLESYKEKKIPIAISGEFYAQQNGRITLEDNLGNSVTCEGETVQNSKNAPLSKEDIETNLARLGDSAYIAKKVNIEKGQNIFLSKSSINRLRRDAVLLLNNKRTKIKEFSFTEYEMDYSAPVQSNQHICCTVSNEEQLSAVLNIKDATIYVRDFDIYSKYKGIADVYYFMPGLNGNTQKYENEKLVIRDTGGIKYAKDNLVTCDYMLNASNSLSLYHLHSKGIKSICLSVELTSENIKDTCNNYHHSFGNYPNCEVLVYGRVQLMALKHCVLQGTIECGECKSSNFAIKDIKGNSFPIITDSECRNFIYSKEPVNKTADITSLKAAGVNGFRFDFFDESAEDIARILRRLH